MCFSDWSLDCTGNIPGLDLYWWVEVLGSMVDVPSKDVDSAFTRVFGEAAVLSRLGVRSGYLDEVAMICMERMAGGDSDRMFGDYLVRRILEIEPTPFHSPERYRLEKLEEWRHQFGR